MHREAPLSPSGPHYRIGAVSKLTGVPVSTLRIWEIRYSAFSPLQTAGKHRLFEISDVKKAELLKRLNAQGHAIRSIAGLSLEELEGIEGQIQASLTPRVEGSRTNSLCVATIGSGLGIHVHFEKLLLRPLNASIEVSDAFSDLNSALVGPFNGRPEILIVNVNSLNSAIREQIDTLNSRFALKRMIILYTYGPASLIRSMRNSGMLVKRQPITEDELFDLVSSELFVDPLLGSNATTASIVIPQRQYSDEVLARVAGISTSVLCECPKHVAELISRLASFEEYSQECLNSSADDAHLHAYLKSVSGSARAMFERALEMVARLEGISLAN